jgi:hypothetical protein
MKTSVLNLLTSIFLFSTFISFGQTKSKEENSNDHRIDQEFEARLKITNDSLFEEFKKKPKLLNISYEKNGVEKSLDNAQFFILIDSVEFHLKPQNSGQFQIEFLVDSSKTVILKLLIGEEKFIQSVLPRKIQNGATIIFGTVTDFNKQNRRINRKIRNNDMTLSKREKFYNEIFDPESLNEYRKIKKIKKIAYVQITPRVFGCGTVDRYFTIWGKFPIFRIRN